MDPKAHLDEDVHQEVDITVDEIKTLPVNENDSDAPAGESQAEQEGAEEDEPQSSIENMIPLKKLKHGWFAISGFVSDKATEMYNSESVQHIKQTTTETIEKTTEAIKPAWEKTTGAVKPALERTAEAVKPAWDKTVEVATPIWEKTKATTMVIAEKTKENVTLATESVKPAVRNVSMSSFFVVVLYVSHRNTPTFDLLQLLCNTQN
jgi:hypothetical protein